MARLFGRILSSIWDDADFLALDDGEQRMYAFLLSQKNLNHAGLLQLTLGKWARKARNSTRERLVAQLQALDAARFIVLDFETEEVLVRTLVRNDSVYKQPRVMGAMVSDAREIESLRLRAALLAEVDRVPLDELNDKPGDKGGPSIRAQVTQHIADLRAAFGPIPTPPHPPRYPLDEPPIEDLAEPPYDPLYDEVPQEDGQGSTRVGASPRARALPYPVTPGAIPTPLNPLPPDALFDVEEPANPAQGAGKPRKAAKAKPPVDPEVAARNKLAVDLAQEWYDAQSPKPTGKFVAYQQIIYRLLEAEHDPDAVAEALKRCGFALTLPAAEFKLKKIQEERDRVVVPFQRPNSDLGTAAHMARFRERQESLAAAGMAQPTQRPELEVFPWSRSS